MVEIHQERFGRAGLSEQQMKDITAFYLGSSPKSYLNFLMTRR